MTAAAKPSLARLQRSPAPAPAPEHAPKPAAAPAVAPSTPAPKPSGLLQRASPAMGLGVQREVAVGEPGDAFEREADAVADRVVAGGSVGPEAISPVSPQALTQRAPAPDGKPPTVQRKGSGPGPMDEIDLAESKGNAPHKPLQKEALKNANPDAGANAQAAQQAAASHAIASKGEGKPMQASTRDTLESGLGTDLGDVRVHDDAAAQSSASALDARAFTHGNDIWLGAGASQDDTHLMAHEATHVVQQSGGVHRRVQRLPAKTPPAAKAAKGAAPPTAPGGGATVDHSARTITIPELRVPKYTRKANAIPAPLVLPKKPERPSDQRDVWVKGVLASGGYASNVNKHIDAKRGIKSARTGKMVHVLEPSNSGIHIVGDAASLPEKLALPRWNKDGSFSAYDVDHLREMQLGGANEFGNMEMLDAGANRSSGSQIHNEIVGKLGEAVKPEVGKGLQWKRMPDLAKVQKDYTVSFTSVVPSLDVAGDPKNFWSRDAVTAGDQVKPLTTLTAQQISARHLVGDDTHLVVYPRPAGGTAKNIPWKPSTNTPGSFKGGGIFKNFEATDVSYQPGKGGSITGVKRFGKDLLERQKVTWALNEMEGLDYTTYVDRGSVLKSIAMAKLKGASPIEFSEIGLDDDGAFAAHGVLRPDLPLLKGLEIDIDVVDDNIMFSKTFSADDLSFPGPIQVTSSNLTLAAGTGGLSVDGELEFEVDRLGSGKLSGMGSFGGATGAGFGVKGSFELDKKVFDGEARIEAGYEHRDFWGKGHLSIGPGKIRGIKSASIDASFGSGIFSATGAITPDIPAVESASLSVEYGEAAGLKFAGDLAIKKDTPGIEGGMVHVEALRAPGSEDFKVKAAGTAKPKVPGFDTMLAVTYDDGTFDASITAAYNKGRLKGSVLVGATNRPVANGQPAGPAPPKGDKITVYGGGSVTVVIAPWLQGTVGVRLLPNGEVELSGEVALPSSLDIFPEKKLEKNIFKIGIDIPIVGVSVAGQRIGIFASISGGLDVSAGIGPGQLQQLGLKVTYNPAHEEDTRVQGGASLHIPAHAGLRLFVRGGLGAGIPVVSAQAGLEIGASLGLEGALDTGVQVDWTPNKGLVLDANASVYVEPKLKVDVSGFVTVDADLLVHTINLYEKHWQLAGFEYGSGLRFGVSFPVHYEEGKPLDLSLDNMKFDVPQINPKEMLSDLVSRIA